MCTKIPPHVVLMETTFTLLDTAIFWSVDCMKKKKKGFFNANKLETVLRKIKLCPVSLPPFPYPPTISLFSLLIGTLLCGVCCPRHRGGRHFPSLGSWGESALYSQLWEVVEAGPELTDLQDDYKVRAWFPVAIVLIFEKPKSLTDFPSLSTFRGCQQTDQRPQI